MDIQKNLSRRPHFMVSCVIVLLSLLLLWRYLPGIHTYQSDLAANQMHEATVLAVTKEVPIPPDPARQHIIFQELRVRVQIGETQRDASLENDITPFQKGEKIYVRVDNLGTPDEVFSIVDARRQSGLLWLTIIFIVLCIAVAGKKGIQALVGLVFSIAMIFAFIIPRILAGDSPILIGILGAFAIVVVSIYLVDGFNPKSITALIGITISLIITAIMTWVVVHKLHFSGYTGEESFYFNQETGNTISLIGILVAGIIIAALGILDDVAITQSSTVFVLAKTQPNLTRRELFSHAMSIGHDHIAAVINTLALAYLGASLPLLLLLQVQKFAIGYTINVEIIATEIVRILVATSGLMLVVPITTLIAVLWARRNHSQTPSAS